MRVGLGMGVWMPALSFHQEPGRGHGSGCKFILLDGPKLVKDWCPELAASNESNEREICSQVGALFW